jgi:hypothetical protein
MGAPTGINWTVIFKQPFSGQFSELPFQDPWWKPFGIGMVIGAGINMIVDAVAEKCGSDYMDPATEKLNNGLACVGGAAAAADVKDPFRWGEENTIPEPLEMTLSEEARLIINYDAPPVPGQPFSGSGPLGQPGLAQLLNSLTVRADGSVEASGEWPVTPASPTPTTLHLKLTLHRAQN